MGVLALQGDVSDHRGVLESIGANTIRVRRTDDLAALDGLVIPGGESTTMAKLAVAFELWEPLQAVVRGGLPVLGTCAGMVLLADRIECGARGQRTLGGLDVTVRRNGFGGQQESFEEDLAFEGINGTVRAVFIRAPWVVESGAGVEVLARSAVGGRIVAVRQGRLLATSFHPEVSGDTRLHRSFLDLVRAT